MHPFWASFSVFVVFLTVESVASWIFIRGSRKHYPVLWEHAGCPTLLGDSDLISAWATNRYLLHRAYQQLGDTSAVRFAERLRLPMSIGYFGSLISVGAFFAFLLFFNRS